MDNALKSVLFVFAVLFVLAGLRMAFAIGQPYIAGVSPDVAQAIDYIVV